MPMLLNVVGSQGTAQPHVRLPHSWRLWARSGEWRSGAFTVLLALLAARLLGAQVPAEPIRTLTQAREVHQLAPELTGKYRASLVGTVTYYDPAEHNMFVHDATGGVYVETTHPYPVSKGDLISIEGGVVASYRSEVAPDPVIRVLGKGKVWPAHRVTYPQLATGEEDSQLVILRGVVRAINREQHENAPIVHLDVLMPGGEVEVYQPASVQDDAGSLFRHDGQPSLLDAEVEITGVAGGAFDAKSQLTGVIVYAQHSSSIRVIKPAAVSPLALPLTEIDNIFRSRRVENQSERVRIRGVLTFYLPGDSAVLEQDGKSVYVQTRETNPLPLGTVVDAIGFASDQEYAPSLRQAELFSTGRKGTIVPRATTFDEAMSGLHSDNLIAVTGVLVSQLHTLALDTVAIDVDGHLVTGRLARVGALPQQRVGTRVRLVGVCRIVPGGPYRAPILFHIDMRDPSDMQLLSTPSWFTVRHLAALLGALSIFALAAGGWAMLLRHRVRRQTQRIERSMLIARRRSELIERISSSQPLCNLIPTICECATQLLPNTTCVWHEASGSQHSGMRLNGSPAATVAGWETYYQVDLFGMGEVFAGRLCFVGAPTAFQSEQTERAEVATMLTEVAQLAIEHCQLYEGLVHHSTHDPLTDLPNRRHCEDRLRSLLATAEGKNSRVAVVYIDINRFKQVNDRYGHKVGDAYLRAIGARLKEKLRPGDMLARIGGDEFLAIAPDLDSFEDAQQLLVRLQACFQQPFTLEGRRIEGSASFGLACYPEQGENAEELKRVADQAMYVCKHTANLENEADHAGLNIVSSDELEAALSGQKFRLAYQPQFAADGRFAGLEALLRLEDGILGTLRPDAFLAAAERSDLLVPIGQWVLRTAIEDAIRWSLHEGPPVLLGINVAHQQLTHAEFTGFLASFLAQTGFPPERLELEISERTAVASSATVARHLVHLRALGVRISLDDFGTGQSSLSALHRLPVDSIKIDRTFVSAMEKEPAVLPVVRAIASMAHSLGKRIVAEGLESVGPVPALLAMGQMDFQGFLLSPPVPAADVERQLPLWREGFTMPAVFADCVTNDREAGERQQRPDQAGFL